MMSHKHHMFNGVLSILYIHSYIYMGTKHICVGWCAPAWRCYGPTRKHVWMGRLLCPSAIMCHHHVPPLPSPFAVAADHRGAQFHSLYGTLHIYYKMHNNVESAFAQTYGFIETEPVPPSNYAQNWRAQSLSIQCDTVKYTQTDGCENAVRASENWNNVCTYM